MRTEGSFHVQNTYGTDRFVVNAETGNTTCQGGLYLNGGLTVGGYAGKSTTVVISEHLSLKFAYGVL